MRKLNENLKNKINLKEKEIQKINDYYEDRKTIAQEEGKEKVELQRMRYNDLLISDTERSQKILEEADQNIKEQTSKLEEGLHQFQLKNEDQYLNEKNQLDQKLFDIKGKFEETSEEMAHRSKVDLQKLQTQTNLELSQKREEVKHQINSLERENEFKLSSKEKLFKNEIANTELQQLKERNTLKDTHLDEMRKLQGKFLVDQETLATNNVTQLTKQEENQKLLLKQKEDVFKEKYTSLIEQHRKALEEIQKRNKLELDSIKKSFEAEKNYIQTLAQDEFYTSTRLTPEVIDLGPSYEVSIQVPEHEKETVNLSGDKRKITVSLTRRFQDRTEDPQTNTVNRTSRSETFQQEINVPEIVDSRKIVSQYDNGTLKFIIPKL